MKEELKEKIYNLAKEKITMFNVLDVTLTGSECGAQYGSIKISNHEDFYFTVGFVFLAPERLSLTASLKNIEEMYYFTLNDRCPQRSQD